MKVGQKVYLKPMGNAARRSTGNEIIEAEIIKVGRKYFEVEPKWYGRFEIKTLTQDGGAYTPDYQAYFSKQEIEDEREVGELSKKFYNFFMGKSKASLKTLRQIDALLNKDQNVQASVATEPASNSNAD